MSGSVVTGGGRQCAPAASIERLRAALNFIARRREDDRALDAAMGFVTADARVARRTTDECWEGVVGKHADNSGERRI